MGFKKPEKTINGTKILIYGEAGTRKTRSALSFPRNAYINSDQGGDDYYEEFLDNITLVSDSTTFAEVMDDMSDIEANLDDIDTITLDSITKIYENQQHTALRVAEQRAIKNGRLKEGEGLSQKEWGVIKLNFEKMVSKLFEFKKDGKTIIVIAEGKDEKEATTDSNGNTVFKKVGITPNAQKDFDFDFDIVLEMVRDQKTKKTIGAKVVKDRLGVIEEGEIVENPSYEIWAEAIEKKRQGTVKAKKRNLEDDLDNDAKSFTATSGVNKHQDLIEEITKVIDKLAPEKKNELAAGFKEKFKTTKYKDVTDVKTLSEMLEFARHIK